MFIQVNPHVSLSGSSAYTLSLVLSHFASCGLGFTQLDSAADVPSPVSCVEARWGRERANALHVNGHRGSQQASRRKFASTHRVLPITSLTTWTTMKPFARTWRPLLFAHGGAAPILTSATVESSDHSARERGKHQFGSPFPRRPRVAVCLSGYGVSTRACRVCQWSG